MSRLLSFSAVIALVSSFGVAQAQEQDQPDIYGSKPVIIDRNDPRLGEIYRVMASQEWGAPVFLDLEYTDLVTGKPQIFIALDGFHYNRQNLLINANHPPQGAEGDFANIQFVTEAGQEGEDCYHLSAAFILKAQNEGKFVNSPRDEYPWYYGIFQTTTDQRDQIRDAGCLSIGQP